MCVVTQHKSLPAAAGNPHVSWLDDGYQQRDRAGVNEMLTMDYGALPPEINSARMYLGPRSAPMLAAAAAWDGLAAELHSTASTYESTISRLTSEGWLGPASASMAAAVAPYVTWLTRTGAEAEQTAAQALAAAGAYEAAFATTVPPALVAANRAQLTALVATNYLGQNTPAIATTEAQYGEMWAQDAAAMYSYANSSAAASVLKPFKQPAQTTNPAGLAGQAAAISQVNGTAATSGTQTTLSQLTSAVPSALQSLASPVSTTHRLGFLELQLFQRAHLSRICKPRNHSPGDHVRGVRHQLLAGPRIGGSPHAPWRRLQYPCVCQSDYPCSFDPGVGAHARGFTGPRRGVGSDSPIRARWAVVRAAELDGGCAGGQPGGCHLRGRWLDHRRRSGCHRPGGHPGGHAGHPGHARRRHGRARLRTWASLRIPRDRHATAAGRGMTEADADVVELRISRAGASGPALAGL